MADSKTTTTKTINKTNVKMSGNQGVGSGLFLVTYIGALVYFIHVSYGFWPTIWSFFKAAVWPAFVVYHVLLTMHA